MSLLAPSRSGRRLPYGDNHGNISEYLNRPSWWDEGRRVIENFFNFGQLDAGDEYQDPETDGFLESFNNDPPLDSEKPLSFIVENHQSSQLTSATEHVPHSITGGIITSTQSRNHEEGQLPDASILSSSHNATVIGYADPVTDVASTSLLQEPQTLKPVVLSSPPAFSFPLGGPPAQHDPSPKVNETETVTDELAAPASKSTSDTSQPYQQQGDFEVLDVGDDDDLGNAESFTIDQETAAPLTGIEPDDNSFVALPTKEPADLSDATHLRLNHYNQSPQGKTLHELSGPSLTDDTPAILQTDVPILPNQHLSDSSSAFGGVTDLKPSPEDPGSRASLSTRGPLADEKVTHLEADAVGGAERSDQDSEEGLPELPSTSVETKKRKVDSEPHPDERPSKRPVLAVEHSTKKAEFHDIAPPAGAFDEMLEWQPEAVTRKEVSDSGDAYVESASHKRTSDEARLSRSPKPVLGAADKDSSNAVDDKKVPSTAEVPHATKPVSPRAHVSKKAKLDDEDEREQSSSPLSSVHSDGEDELSAPKDHLPLASARLSLKRLTKPNLAKNSTTSSTVKPVRKRKAVGTNEMAGLFNSPPRKAEDKRVADLAGRLRSATPRAGSVIPKPLAIGSMSPDPLASEPVSQVVESKDGTATAVDSRASTPRYSISGTELKSLGLENTLATPKSRRQTKPLQTKQAQAPPQTPKINNPLSLKRGNPLSLARKRPAKAPGNRATTTSKSRNKKAGKEHDGEAAEDDDEEPTMESPENKDEENDGDFAPVQPRRRNRKSAVERPAALTPSATTDSKPNSAKGTPAKSAVSIPAEVTSKASSAATTPSKAKPTAEKLVTSTPVEPASAPSTSSNGSRKAVASTSSSPSRTSSKVPSKIQPNTPSKNKSITSDPSKLSSSKKQNYAQQKPLQKSGQQKTPAESENNPGQKKAIPRIPKNEMIDIDTSVILEGGRRSRR